MPAPVNTTPPSWSGTPRSGQTLTADPGEWTADGDIGFSYQWKRCDAAGSNCVEISGSTAATRLLTPSDIGSTIKVSVRADDIVPAAVGDAYFVSDWSTGLIGYPPWTTIFLPGNPGYLDVGYYGNPPVASSPDGRVAVVSNPYGAGNVLKCELRNTDASSGGNVFHKSEMGTIESLTWDGSWSSGQEIWIAMEWYLPNEFGLASGGSNAFSNLADLHPNSNSGIPALGLGGYSTTNIQLYAGTQGLLQRKNFIPLTSGNRNRRLNILIGAKIATSGGWVEAWLDGVNTIPRFSVNTAEASESGPYWKQGLYKRTDASYPGGKSIIYFGSTLLYASSPLG